MNKISFQLLTAMICLLASLQLSAKEIPSNRPERQGFSTEGLNKITEHMNAKVEDGTMVGGMGLVARNGKIIYQQAYGFADLGPLRTSRKWCSMGRRPLKGFAIKKLDTDRCMARRMGSCRSLSSCRVC